MRKHTQGAKWLAVRIQRFSQVNCDVFITHYTCQLLCNLSVQAVFEDDLIPATSRSSNHVVHSRFSIIKSKRFHVIVFVCKS